MKEGFLRNFVFGVEDSLVSTVGFISGVASAHVERQTLILTGIVLVAVEAFSMAVGSFLSDTSAREHSNRRVVALGPSVFGGAVMFTSYVLSGMLVLVPYWFIPVAEAFRWSIGVSLGALFVLGSLSGALTRRPMLRRGLRMMFLGGLAILLGVSVAQFIS